MSLVTLCKTLYTLCKTLHNIVTVRIRVVFHPYITDVLSSLPRSVRRKGGFFKFTADLLAANNDKKSDYLAQSYEISSDFDNKAVTI